MTRNLLILGASVRAAAQSAIRAGYTPFAIDQFADDDLTACCQALRITDYPSGFIDLARQFPTCPFMFTGALENYPEVIARLQRERTLWGCQPTAIEGVRDVTKLRQCLSSAGLSMPEIRDELPATESSWVKKPRRSGGGIGIERMSPLEYSPVRTSRTHYFERFIPGDPISAIFVGAGRRAWLLGATSQLTGCRWAGASEFLYIGNIGPVTFRPSIMESLKRAGTVLASEFELAGLFGIDGLICDDQLWILEVNPRYTSAVEILEHSMKISALQTHVDACSNRSVSLPAPAQVSVLFGKAIIYARESTLISPHFSKWVTACLANSQTITVADVPHEMSRIAAGHPICTVFAQDTTRAGVEQQLKDLAAKVYFMLEQT